MPTVLHLSPHPDDELLGAPATLMALRDAGWRVVNLACGLGSEVADRERRRAELVEACRRARFELRLAAPDAEEIAAAVAETGAELVVSPSPHDGHPAHELVAREARTALASPDPGPPRWWLWGLWADLPLPTLLVIFDDERRREIDHALGAHATQLARSDLSRLLAARAQAAAVLGPERVLGFGTPGTGAPYAELLTELVPAAGSWRAGAPRVLDPDAPFADATGEALDWWLDAPSVRSRARPPR
jgi:LmbE family N-acetylglucosaminyl deacetylase